MFLGAPLIGEVTQELSSESVNVDAFEIVKFATAKIENRRSDNGAYAIASAIEYVSIHDRSPLYCRTTKLRPSAANSELDRNLRHVPPACPCVKCLLNGNPRT